MIGMLILLRVDTLRLAASSSYRRTPDRSPGQAPVSRGPDWIPAFAGMTTSE
jgi:hypothetical protein